MHPGTFELEHGQTELHSLNKVKTLAQFSPLELWGIVLSGLFMTGTTLALLAVHLHLDTSLGQVQRFSLSRLPWSR